MPMIGDPRLPVFKESSADEEKQLQFLRAKFHICDLGKWRQIMLGRALRAAEGNQKLAAGLLGMSYGGFRKAIGKK